MATIIETGHAINISNFKLLIDKCGMIPPAIYNPSNPDISIANMTTQWTTADFSHQALTAAIQAAKGPINDRDILYKPVNKITTKSLNYFQSTKASKQAKADAKGLADKIRGFKTQIPKLPDGTPDPNHVSQSHQSFVQKQDTFKQLLDLYAADPNYAPNELALQIPATLGPLNTAMKAANDNMGTVLAPVIAARLTRNNLLYAPDTGVLDVAAACKDYIISLFGARTAESRPFTSIKFRRPTDL